jgi:hypothetical protein
MKTKEMNQEENGFRLEPIDCDNETDNDTGGNPALRIIGILIGIAILVECSHRSNPSIAITIPITIPAGIRGVRKFFPPPSLSRKNASH